MLRVEPIELGAGQSLAIRGVSGSGKSTLLGLLSGELLPDSGTVAFNGINLSTQSSAQRRNFRIRNTGIFFIATFVSGRKKLPCLRSMLELKEHIQTSHMDLCLEVVFVSVRNLPAKLTSQPFNYLLCTLCGQCFSQV